MPRMPHFKHKAYITTRRIVKTEIDPWCREQFGPRFDLLDNITGTWTYAWAGPEHMTDYEFRFVNDKDAFLFRLRWL